MFIVGNRSFDSLLFSGFDAIFAKPETMLSATLFVSAVPRRSSDFRRRHLRRSTCAPGFIGAS